MPAVVFKLKNESLSAWLFPEATDRFRVAKRTISFVVAYVKSQALEGFAEAVEMDFWLALRRFCLLTQRYEKRVPSQTMLELGGNS